MSDRPGEPDEPEAVEIVDAGTPDDEWEDDAEGSVLDLLGGEEDGESPLSALFGGGEGGGLDMGSILDSAMQMQQQVMAAREEAASQVVEGVAGGGVVRIEVTGGMEFRGVSIAPDAVDPDDLTLLEDLVLAALHDAVAKANGLQADAMGGLGLPGTEMI